MNIEKIQIKKLFSKADIKIENFNIKNLGSGFQNENWKITDTVSQKEFVVRVRFFKPNDMEEKRFREANVLKELNGSFGAPKLYFHSPTEELFDGRAVLITEFIHGEEIKLDKVVKDDIKFAAKFLSDLHRKEYDLYNLKGIIPNTQGTLGNIAKLSLEGMQQYTTSIAEFNSEKQQKLSSKMQSFGIQNWDLNKFSINHGDFGFYNVLKLGDKYSVIDWEKAKITDPISEVARFSTNLEMNQDHLSLENASELFEKEYFNYVDYKYRSERLNFYKISCVIDQWYWGIKNLSDINLVNKKGSILIQIERCEELLDKYLN